MSAVDDLVLKLTTYLPGGMEWKPDLHPRDHNGKFATKGSGVFNALNDIKAGKYASGIVTGKPGHHFGANPDIPEVEPGQKIGGVEIHAPTEHGYAPSTHSIDWKLNPGDKVYKVTGGPKSYPSPTNPGLEVHKGQNGVIVHHNDGSATSLMPTPEGEMPKVGLQDSHFSNMQNVLQAMGYEIDTAHPIDANDELEAEKFKAEVAAVEEAKKIGAAPESAYGTLYKAWGYGQIGKDKEEGTYGAFDPDGKLLEGGFKTPQKAQEFLQKAKLEAGSKKQIKSDSVPVAPAASSAPATPSAPSTEKKIGEPGPGGNPVVQNLFDETSGKHIGHIEKTPEGKYTSHDASGKKVGNISKHVHTAVEKVKSGKLTTPTTYTHKKPLKAAAKEAAKATPEPAAPKVEPKPEPVKAEAHKVSIKDLSDNKIGHIQHAESGNGISAHDAEGKLISEGHKSATDAGKAVKKHNIDKVTAQAVKEEPKVTEPVTKAPEATVEHKEPAHLEGKSVFQHVHDDNGKHIGHIEKLENGKFTSHNAAGEKIGNISKHLPTAIEKVQSGKLTTPTTYTHKKGQAPTEPVEVKIVKDGDKQNIIGDNGVILGHIEKDAATGKWQSYDANGKKIGYTISNMQTAIDKVKANAPDQAAVDKALGKKEEPLAEWEKELLAEHVDVKHETTEYEKEMKATPDVAETVDLPMYGGSVQLMPGEAVYHETSSSPFVAIVSDGKVQYIQNPETGKIIFPNPVADSPANGWQAGLETGTLVPLGHEVEPEKAPVTESVVDKAESINNLPGLPTFDQGGKAIQLEPGEVAWQNIDPKNGSWVFKPNGKADGYTENGAKVISNGNPPVLNANSYTGDKWIKVGEGPAIHAPNDSEKSHAPVVEQWKSGSGSTLNVYSDGMAEIFTANGEKAPEGLQPHTIAEAQALLQQVEVGSIWTKVAVPGAEKAVAEAPVKKAGATPKVAKKKVVKDTDLPKEFKLGEKTYQAKPGDTILTKEIDGDTKVYHVKGWNGKGTLYNSDGSLNHYLGSDKKLSLASLKKQGWEKVAAGEAKQEIAGPDLAPTKDFGGNGSGVYNYANDASYYLTGYQSALYNQNMDAAAEEVGKQAAEYIANLNFAKENAVAWDLDKSDKMKITKALNYANAMWTLHSVAKKVDDPNYEPSDQDKATLEEANTIFVKAHHNTPTQAAKKVVAKIKEAEFKANLSDIGFDIDHGSHEEFVNYAGQNGASFIGGMDEQMVKDWTHAHLGVPGYHGDSKASIEGKASQFLKMKAVAAHAEAVNDKKKAFAPTKEEQQVEKAVTKAYESLYKKVGKLQTEYYHPDGSSSITHQSDGSFYAYGPDVDGQGEGVKTSAYFSPEELVGFLENHPEWKPSSDAEPLGSGAQQVVNTLTGSGGYDLEHLQEAPSYLLQDLGAQGADVMTDGQRKMWILSHLNGDSVGKYQLEKAALTTAGVQTAELDFSHPGSPLSPSGIAANQALANHLATLPIWKEKKEPLKLSAWSDDIEGSKQLVEALGVKDAYSALGDGQTTWPEMAMKWVLTHKDLPQAKTVDSAPEDAQLESMNGTKFTVPHGALVAAMPSGNYQIFTDSHAIVVDKYGTKGEPIAYPPNFDKIKAYATAIGGENGQDSTPKWQDNGGEHQTLKLVEKPEGVTQNTWDFVTGAEAGGKDLVAFVGDDIAQASDDETTNKIFNSGSFSKADALKLSAAPPAIRKLAAWAAINTNNYDDEAKRAVANEVAKALVAKSKAGEYITPETESWKHPEGTATFTVPPGASIYKGQQYGDPIYVAVLNDQNAMMLTSNGGVGNYYSHNIANLKASGDEVFTSKANLSLDKAHSEGQEFTQPAFDAVAKAEEQPVWKSSHHAEPVAAFAFKEAIKKIDGGEKYAPLTNYIHTLPAGVKQLAVESASKKNTDTLDAILWKYNKGAYALQPEQPEGPKVDPDASYAANVAKGQVTHDAVENHWSGTAVEDFIKDYNLDVDPYAYYSNKTQAVAEHLKSITPEPVNTNLEVSKGMADYQNLELHAQNKTYGGMHSKQGYTDKYGQEWMAKGFNSDPNGPLRVNVEHKANIIGRLFGFNSAQTFTKVTPDGKYSVIQKIEENDGGLNGFQPKDLHKDQLIGAMREHVLDWLIANHDTHEENLIRLPGGKTVLGIDKGQAYKHLGKDKLAVGYLPPENGAPVWYDKFYNGIKNHTVSEELANEVALKVLQRAYEVQTRHDDAYRQHLEQALEGRTSWPTHLNTKEKFIDYAMERKSNMLSDFEKFYKEIFDKAGYEWKIDTEDFGKNVGGAHISNGPTYAEAVKNVSVFGKALFFNSPDLEDGHIMHNTMEQMDGGTALLGAAKIRSEADVALTAWLKERVEGKLAHGQKASVSSVQSPSSQLPSIDNFHNAIVAYSKTVGTHAPNGGKTPDGQYNQSTLDTAKTQASGIELHLAKATEFRAKNPDKLYPDMPGLNTLEQQDAWIAAMEQKLGEYKTVAAAHEQGVPVKDYSPDSVPFKEISYNPTKGLKLHSESAPVEKYDLGNDEFAVKTTDGGHYAVDKSGAKTYLNAQEYGNATAGKDQIAVDEAKPESWSTNGGQAVYEKQPDGKWKNKATDTLWDHADFMNTVESAPAGTWTHDPGSLAQPQEQSQTVEIANKIFKVSHRAAAIHGGQMDAKTGKLIEIKKMHSDDLQTGYEYTIEHGNVRIHYRPWTETGVAKAQQGQLSYEVRNWDGGHQAIDDVLDTLRIAGVNVTPADAESLEHHYWNHLTNVIQDRADASSVKHMQIVKAVKDARLSNPNMTTSEHLDALKKAWSDAYGKDVVAKANWQPQFSTQYGEESGRPHWKRPDVSVEDLKNIYGYKLPTHSVSGSGAHNILLSGKLLPTEERPRLGINTTGMSSTQDQHHGSSGFVFTRQNMSQTLTAGYGEPLFITDPTTALRTSTYAFNGDKYGDLEARKNYAHYDPKKMYTHDNGSNEMMVKHEAPIFVALFEDNAVRDKELASLKQAGVEHINGRKLEDVLLTQAEWNKTYQARIDKLWEEMIEKEKIFTEGGA
jgi:hypothetical protein